MTFEFNPETGLITFGYVKITIDTLVVYIGALIGFLKHYWNVMSLAKEQAKASKMNEEQLAEYKKAVRAKFISDNSKVFYDKVEKLAKLTSTKLDDKAVFYAKKFTDAFKAATGSEPTEAELKLMHAHASAHAFRDSHGPKKPATQKVKPEKAKLKTK